MLMTEKPETEVQEALISSVCMMKVMRPGVFEKLVEGKATILDVQEAFKYYPDPKSDNYVMEHVIKCFHACLISEAELALLDDQDEIKRMARYWRNRSKVVELMSQRLNSFSAR